VTHARIFLKTKGFPETRRAYPSLFSLSNFTLGDSERETQQTEKEDACSAKEV